ncbi:MAG TPA: tyrosine-type recombinase/integrase [Chitinophagaceae bacterium]|nr:tyrosine-type recombinase/integrase [Chitinophagaceae bacterium]
MENHYTTLQPFFDYLKFEKRYSQHTIVAYQTDLASFFDFVTTQYGHTPLQELSHTYIRSWLATLKDEGLSAKSIARKISTLKSFFKYQIKTGLLQQSPMGKVVTPKIEKRLPNFIADKDIKTLFDHVEFPDTLKGQTERLILLLFYQTGIRLSEAIGLKESGINFSNNTIKVLGKGSKERIIPLNPELQKEIKNYLERKKADLPGLATDVVLVTKKGAALAPRGVYNAVKYYLNQVTTIEKRSPHVLRHTFATHLTNNGADLNAVKELLGHSSLAATQVYTHNSIDRLKGIHQKAHPKA